MLRQYIVLNVIIMTRKQILRIANGNLFNFQGIVINGERYIYFILTGKLK